MLKRCTASIGLLTALLGLAACAEGTDNNVGSGEARSATSAAVVAPTLPSTPATSSSASTTAAASTRAATGGSEASTAGSAAASGYTALPQSRTAEGYYVLGNPDAPVTLTHYSDFI